MNNRHKVLRQGRIRALFAVLAPLFALAGARSAEAANDPSLDWQTIHTKHFRVHYPRGLESVAERVARINETVHDRLIGPLGYSPDSITEMVITDNTDSANGSASALPYNNVRLFVTAPEDMSILNDYDDWYLDLITHEYTHILHVDNIRGLPAVVNTILGKTLAPNQVQPRWIIEGLAVLAESEHTSAGRLRSTIADMYTRTDVLSGNLAGLDQMSNYPFRWPQGNLWYLTGSRFLSWICDVYGKDTMRAVSRDYGSTLIPWGINRSIRRATGKTYIELYDGFRDFLKRQYGDQMREVEKRGLREGVRLTHHGRFVEYPRFVPKAHQNKPLEGDDVLYYRNDFSARSGLYRFKLRGGKITSEGETLIARTTASSVGAFLPSGDLVFNSVTPWRNFYSRDDLYWLGKGQTSQQGDENTRKQMTEGLRATSPDISPDGKRMVFTVNSMGTTFLEIAELKAGGAPEHIPSLSPRRRLVPSARFEQVYTPRFSPDGKSVAYSRWRAGGYRDIHIAEVDTGHVRTLTSDRAMDMQPVFSDDGKTLYFCSDRSGIPNIYAFDLASGALKQVTNVRTGAFQPAISPDGKTLVYTGYTKDGFDLFAMPLDSSRFLDALPPPQDRPPPPPEPAPVEMRKSAYEPLRTLAPRSYLLNAAPGKYGPLAVTVTARGGDVVGNHGIAASVVADPAAPTPELYLDYTYRRLPVDLGARLFYSVSPRTGYRISDQDLSYNERSLGLTAGVSYPINLPFSYHSLGMSYSIAAFKGDLPVGRKLDPYATRTVDPLSGNIGVAHLGYFFSNVEGSYDAAGSARGFALSLSADFAERATASDFTLQAFSAVLSAYFQMPWPGHHTLALRSSGAISGGGYPSGNYFVGGYDLENYTLIDTVTTGIFNGAFVLRGYKPGTYSGRAYALQNIEYRVPIVKVDRGPWTLPLYLQRIDGNLFLDFGGAFDRLKTDRIRFFENGYLIDSPDLHSGAGAELWFTMTLGYGIYSQFRLGYAYGFSAAAIPSGQFYFVASSAY